MRKQLCLLVMTLGFVLIIGCNSKELNNQWTDQPIKIDGDYSDWEGIDLQYFEELNLVMGSLNDAENLYLMFRFTDQKLARKIQKMGVTCWLDKNGKKDKKYGVQYTGSVNLHSKSRPEIETSNKMPLEKKERMDNLMERLRANLPGPGKIFVIKGEEEAEIGENQTQGPSAGSANHDGIFCFEFRMPIPISAKLGDEISLCMELGGLSAEDLSQLQQQRGSSQRSGDMMGGRGVMGRGGGKGAGSGMGGGRGMGSSEQRPRGLEGLEKQEIWMKLILAEKEVKY